MPRNLPSGTCWTPAVVGLNFCKCWVYSICLFLLVLSGVLLSICITYCLSVKLKYNYYNLFRWEIWFKKIASGKKYIDCKIFVMQGLYLSMQWDLLTLTFHKESFVLGQKTIHHLSWVMTLLMKVNQKMKTVSSHWQIPKNTPVTKKCFWFMNQIYWNY